MSLLLASLILLSPQDKRPPVPGEAAQKEAEKIVRDIFKEDYAKKTPAARVALAAKMLQQGVDTLDSEPAVYVLLREARDLALLGGDTALAFKAISELSRRFQVNAVEMKAAALASAGKTARTAEEFVALAKTYSTLVEDAMAVEEFDTAERAAEAGAGFARKGKDLTLLSRLEAKRKEAVELRGRLAKVGRAIATLEKNADDAEAHAVLGQYLALVKGAWEEGLDHLARGSDPSLKAAAVRDLANPAEERDQIAAGDAWWDVGEKDVAAHRSRWRARAATWYLKARDRSSGLTLSKLDQRIESAAVASGRAPVDLLKLIDPVKDRVMGGWTIVDGKLVSPKAFMARLEIPYTPPEEYDLVAVVESDDPRECVSLGLIAGESRFLAIIDGWTATRTVLAVMENRAGDEGAYNGKVLLPGKPNTIVCSVRNTRLTVSVNGQTLIDWKADYRRLSLEDVWATPHPKALIVGAYQSVYRFSKLTLVPVTGNGQRLRY